MIMKKCQIYTRSPITCFQVPIVGTADLNLTPDEIYKCLCAKAEVSEILPNGKMVALNFDNYNRDNSIIDEPEKDKKPELKIETVKVKPVVDKTVETIIEEKKELPVEKETVEEVVEEVLEETKKEEIITEVETEKDIDVVKEDNKPEVSSNTTDYKVQARNNNNKKNYKPKNYKK